MKRLFSMIPLLFLAFTSFAQKTYNLRFKPIPNEKYNAVTQSKATVTQSIMGQEMAIAMDYTMDMIYEVGKEGANTILDLTYDKLGMKMDAMGQNVEMTSEDTVGTSPMNSTFKSLKGAKVSVVVNAAGEVIEVRGTDELIDRLGSKVSAAEKETMKNIISKESLKSMIVTSTKIFPGNPVKVGDTWTVDSELEVPYKLKSSNTYKLIKVEDGVAFLEMSGSLTTGGLQTMSSQGMEMQVDLSGAQEGTLQIFEATGISKNAEIKQTLKGKMEIMGQEVPMSVVNESKTVMTKK